jgi:hypothetical protein
MTTRSRNIIRFLESRARPVRKADNLAAIYAPIGVLNVSQSYRPTRPVMGTPLLTSWASPS